ncbi:hypothetical protein BG004_004075 [Podila humilis]|nr:hypothetical protein BG004_004075 [Podila humilis]
MVDHPTHSTLPYPSQQRQQQHSSSSHSSHSSHYHPPPRSYRPYSHYNQDIQGPLSAGVIEGHRAFPSFHGSFHSHHPLQSSSLPLSSSTGSVRDASGQSSTSALTHNQSSAPASSSSKNMSVSDILERYQDASKDFLVSVLNAKAKEDERKAEEERYKTEQIKLQSKQLELELAMEKRRGSPPTATGKLTILQKQLSAGRALYPAAEASNGHYSASGSAYYSAYPSYSSSDKHHHHDHIVHTPQDSQDHPQSAHVRPPYSSQQQQQQQQQHASQRQPHSPHSNLPPLPGPNSSKGSGRHYGLPTLSNTSAQSSPVTMVDYQSHIPPPVTPKDDHLSPTSAISPTQSANLKRKSINHDAIMDAVRAKVLRNAGQNQQREQLKKAAGESTQEREQPTSRRKTHHANNSPETPKRPAACATNTPASTNPTVQEARLEDKRERDTVKIKQEGPLLSSLPLASVPSSPPEPSSGASSHSARSRSSSPTSAKARRQASQHSAHISHSGHPSPETSGENSPTARRGGEAHPDSGVLSSIHRQPTVLHHSPDDDILDINTSDHEWTSIWHTNSARAKARHEQFYREQEQQRAQEWHLVLDQHQKASLTSASHRSINLRTKALDPVQSSEDECEQENAQQHEQNQQQHAYSTVDSLKKIVLSISPVPSTPEQEHRVVLQEDSTIIPAPETETDFDSGDRTSHFDFSDMASDSLDGLGEWSHDDDDESVFSSSATSIRSRRHSYVPSRNTRQRHTVASPCPIASAASLSNLARPSFAQSGCHDTQDQSNHSTGDVDPQFQNKMPFHDGSGNFSQDLPWDSEGGWESSTSGVSSILSSYSRRIARQHLIASPRSHNGPISSPEFGSVLQSIATLQGQLYSPQQHSHNSNNCSSQQYHCDIPFVAQSAAVPSRASKPHRQRYHHGQLKLQSCSVYESEMEDIEAMVIDIPSKMGWLQVFEQALNIFNNHTQESTIYSSYSNMNTIKAIAHSSNSNGDVHATDSDGVSKGAARPNRQGTGHTSRLELSSARTHAAALPLTLAPSTLSELTSASSMKSPSTQLQMKHLHQKVSASSLDALQRLQKRQKSEAALHQSTFLASPQTSTVDPMHVEFAPTIKVDLSTASTASAQTKKSTSTMTGSSGGHRHSDGDTNMLASVISTLRRLRDHVKSNLLHAEFDQVESNYLSGIGFEGDLGMEYAIGLTTSEGTSSKSESSSDFDAISISGTRSSVAHGTPKDESSRIEHDRYRRTRASGSSSGTSTPFSLRLAAPSRVPSCGIETLALRYDDWA